MSHDEAFASILSQGELVQKTIPGDETFVTFLESPKGWGWSRCFTTFEFGVTYFSPSAKGQSFQDSKPMMLEKVRHDFEKNSYYPDFECIPIQSM